MNWSFYIEIADQLLATSLSAVHFGVSARAVGFEHRIQSSARVHRYTRSVRWSGQPHKLQQRERSLPRRQPRNQPRVQRVQDLWAWNSRRTFFGEVPLLPTKLKVLLSKVDGPHVFGTPSVQLKVKWRMATMAVLLVITTTNSRRMWKWWRRSDFQHTVSPSLGLVCYQLDVGKQILKPWSFMDPFWMNCTRQVLSLWQPSTTGTCHNAWKMNMEDGLTEK